MLKFNIFRDFFIAVLLGIIALALVVLANTWKHQNYPQNDTVVVQSDEDSNIVERTLATGVSGRVVVGPQCPVMREGEDCPDAPFVGVVDLLVNDPERELIARVPTNTDGSFVVTLLKGEYIVIVQHEGTFPICPEEVVIVEENKVADVLVSCDSGIR